MVECNLVSGGYYYPLKMRFANIELSLGVRQIGVLPAISQTHTGMVTEYIKEDSGIPF